MTSFRPVPPDRPLRAILAGAGGMGRAWLRALHDSDLVELVGIVDLDVPLARSVADEFGCREVTVTASVSEAMRSSAADFVVDVTVPAAHYPVTLEAFDLGLAVLGEKPLAATMAEAVRLVDAAHEAGRLFMVSQNRRYDEHLFALKAFCGQLGEVGIISNQFFKAPRFGGFRDVMEHPLLLDMAIHNFDAARFLLDADPLAVYCEEYNPAWSWYAGDAACTAICEMSGGGRYVYTGSWCSPGLETSWDSEWRVSGARGTARWDGAGPPVLDLVDAGSPSQQSPVFPGQAGIRGSLVAFVEALRTGAAPMCECGDNLVSLAMVHAAIESVETGRRVLIADVLDAARADARRLAG